jgi:hypothetical protein
MAARNNTNAARARKLERQGRALELRRMGWGYVEIASALGIGKSQAHRLVKAGLAEAYATVVSEATELRAEELSRLDAMLSGLWPDARKGDVLSVDRVLKIMERRAKLLGLDAPVKLAHGGDPTGAPIKTETALTLTDADLERIAASGSA